MPKVGSLRQPFRPTKGRKGSSPVRESQLEGYSGGAHQVMDTKLRFTQACTPEEPSCGAEDKTHYYWTRPGKQVRTLYVPRNKRGHSTCMARL